MSRQAPSTTRVRITIGGKSIEATLADSEAARDFASLLPITLPMNDLFRREKFAHLPRALPDPTWQSSIARMGSASPIPA